ncbi:MAG: tetratricopeptide repeat protein [bacterium]|nr:tetratricopeptide repeat protein [bacterium]
MKVRNSSYNPLYIPAVLVLLLLMVAVSGCTSGKVVNQGGVKLMHAGQYDEAVEYYEDLLEKYPKKAGLKTTIFRAKLSSYYAHLAKARSLREDNKKEEAVAEYKIALRIFPNNKRISNELQGYLEPEKKRESTFVSYIKPPIQLRVDTSEQISVNLRSTPITKIFKTVGKSYEVNFIFDKDFRDFVYTLETENIGFFDLLNQLCIVGNAKYRIMDPASILVYPNTNFKVRNLGLQGVKMYYLANTKAEDVKKLVMTVFREQRIHIQEDPNLNCLIIKAADNTLREIERFIFSIDKVKGELELDVEILELNRNLIKAIGLTYAETLSKVTAGRNTTQLEAYDGTVEDGTVAAPTPRGGDDSTTGSVSFNNLGETNFFMTLPSAALKFLETDSDTKVVSKPNLRGIDGEEIKFMVGDEIPIPQTQFQAAGAGGYNTLPVTSYNYKSVGVDVKVTPTIHSKRSVTIKVKLKLDYITGYQGDFPTFGKRELETIIRLKEGETSIIGGMVKDEERRSMAGMPWLAKLPLLGRLFGSTTTTVLQTDLVFAITPRIIRWVDVSAEDQAAIWSNAEVGAGQGAGKGGADEEEVKDDKRRSKKRGGNAVTISPNKRKIPVNAVSYFTIRVSSDTEISSLAISGGISGAKAEIEEAKTGFFSGKDDVKVMANTSGDSFDLGYSFTNKPIKNNVVAQLKVKFLEKGNYTISINNVSAQSKERQSVELSTSTAEIEVY